MFDWVRKSSLGRLKHIRASRPQDTLEHRAADEEIHRREAEQAKTDAEAVARLETQRHGETTALARTEISVARWALGIALLALAVSGMSIYWQWRDRVAATNQSRSPLFVAPPTNTPPAVLSPATNFPATNVVSHAL